MKRLFIKVEGIVQGVGFRPFIYNLAVLNNLKGWVSNNSEGVHIDIEGENEDLENFLDNLKFKPPSLSQIEKTTIKRKNLIGYQNFSIKQSGRNEEKITLISPDIATCTKCIKDINDPSNRRYLYPFTNCTNCGPRFSIIESMPYDRNNTTMKKFLMCKECEDEYDTPSDRRFHAEPTACKVCGPKLSIKNANGLEIETLNPIEWTTEMLLMGKIFAIKGLCGFHIACDGTNFGTIENLRIRKGKPHQPLAVMMKDLNTVKNYCLVNKQEEVLLTEIRKPIVVLNKKPNCSLPCNIAPNQKTLGVMLPYTPLHELLFSHELKVLIMTSGNIHKLPLEYKNVSALGNLSKIAHYFLFHDREIHVPLDDSIVKVANEESFVIRRARGYVPNPINGKGIKPILACGADMKNTFCIAKQDYLFLSQHNGDLNSLETYISYKNNIENFNNIFSFSPKYVACDMHPAYLSSKYAESLGLPLIKVQHHHAHIVSAMAENNIQNNVIGVAFDGTGYGTDGKIWGGEFFICNTKSFKRLAHLDYVKMPGGEKAVEEPWRMAVAYLYHSFEKGLYTEDDAKNIICNLYGSKALTLWSIIKVNLNCTETSSMGRFFDAVSSIIGIRNFVSYEGQASIELEALIPNLIYSKSYSYELIKSDYGYVIDVSHTIKELVKDRQMNVSKEICSLKFHNTVVNFTVNMCKNISDITGVNEVVLSGGVFQNSYLLYNITTKLKNYNFTVYSNKIIPTNDGGISLGQIVIANENTDCV